MFDNRDYIESLVGIHLSRTVCPSTGVPSKDVGFDVISYVSVVDVSLIEILDTKSTNPSKPNHL